MWCFVFSICIHWFLSFFFCLLQPTPVATLTCTVTVLSWSSSGAAATVMLPHGVPPPANVPVKSVNQCLHGIWLSFSINLLSLKLVCFWFNISSWLTSSVISRDKKKDIYFGAFAFWTNTVCSAPVYPLIQMNCLPKIEYSAIVYSSPGRS